MVDEGISESFQRPCPELNFKRSHTVAETVTILRLQRLVSTRCRFALRRWHFECNEIFENPKRAGASGDHSKGPLCGWSP